MLGAAGFGLLVVCGAAALVRLGGHGGDAVALWHELDAAHLLLAWSVMTSGMLGLALRWRTFFPVEVRADVAPLTAILFVGILLNYALPGPVAELVGAGLAGRRFGMRPEAALAAAIAARFLGLAVAGLAALLLLQSGQVPLSEEVAPGIRLATVVIAGGACTLAALAAMPHRLQAVADGTVGKLAGKRGFGWLGGLHGSAVRFAHALGSLGHVGAKRVCAGAGWAFAGHALVVAGIWIAADGLGPPPPLAGLAFAYAATTAGAIVVFAMPGGQLGWDAMFASLLVSAAGLPLPTALALTVAVRLQQLSLVLVGAFALVKWLRNGTLRSAG